MLLTPCTLVANLKRNVEQGFMKAAESLAKVYVKTWLQEPISYIIETHKCVYVAAVASSKDDVYYYYSRCVKVRMMR